VARSPGSIHPDHGRDRIGKSAVQRAGDQVALSLGADDRVAFANASFDRIAALHSFQFWAQPERTAPRLRELLRDGGRLVSSAQSFHGRR